MELIQALKLLELLKQKFLAFFTNNITFFKLLRKVSPFGKIVPGGVFFLGRKPRVEFNGAVYHVIQRGNNRLYIFEKEEDKIHLMKLVKHYKGIMGYEIFGFVVMDNHYHIVIKTIDTKLSDIMHRINNQYSKYYNHKNNRTGFVYENRYKGILVKDDKYLLSLIRYVHQNPVHARICKKMKDYKWSSDLYYRQNIRGRIVNIDFILSIFSQNRKEAIKLYSKFMDDEEIEDKSFFEDKEYIGEIEVDKVEANIAPQINYRKSLDEILIEVTKDNSIFEYIKKGSRKRNLTEYKKEYIKIALNFNYTMKEIGENITVSESGIFRMISN